MDDAYPVDEKSHRMKNKTSDTQKNLCIKTKAWNFKKHYYWMTHKRNETHKKLTKRPSTDIKSICFPFF